MWHYWTNMQHIRSRYSDKKGSWFWLFSDTFMLVLHFKRLYGIYSMSTLVLGQKDTRGSHLHSVYRTDTDIHTLTNTNPPPALRDMCLLCAPTHFTTIRSGLTLPGHRPEKRVWTTAHCLDITHSTHTRTHRSHSSPETRSHTDFTSAHPTHDGWPMCSASVQALPHILISFG